MKHPLYTAFGKGAQARQAGLAITANPYTADTQPRLHEAWLRGWETEDRFIRRNANPKGN